MTADNNHPRISLFCAAALKTVLDSLGPDAFNREIGAVLDIDFAPTNVLVQRIKAGAVPDVLIGISASLHSLAASGALVSASVTPLARSGIGLAVSAGTEHPDISTVGTLVRTLTAARSVAYARTSPSGLYFQSLIEKLGIAGEVNSRATVIDHGPTAAALSDGRADLAVQQITELLHVPGAKFLGPLPDAVQHHTEFSAALGASAAGNAGARALIRFLTGPPARTAFAGAGLENP